mmetsp:Transcript_20724/g.26757  ORF Transcript_20724/g.26757 Transcript_20724/m.26757 type:complete len:284 (-) Transcript_20724:192-1043(-)|eukprot:CAMPEP_0198138128 /NCGR_PEP_ID=MMETSP1443-20131203/1544_1 /TAXON_ID=186043 /ORGANISM="Entomoneis sp., Strain CCMP2396" /LENGTH=283 /DNA_ID=CAMNT_0043799773 /DNA_START=98 /DNA_END=949 /DNA_ORIENTATION=+
MENLFLIRLLLLSATLANVSAWIASPRSFAKDRLSITRRFFFKNILDKAFQNDDSLSQNDKVTGQLEGPDEPEPVSRSQLTETQIRWREMDSKAADLSGKSFDFDFYLTGIPDKDPSSDLFGAKVNISARDRKVGQTIPEKPTVTDIRVSFLKDNKCACETDSVFTKKGPDGDWKLSDDGRQIRFRIQVNSFTRTVETRGSIQSVFWSGEPDQVSRTATVYSVPEGWMYGEAEVTGGSAGSVSWQNTVLKIDQPTGLFRAGTTMVPCGIFVAKLVYDDVMVEK